MVAEQAGASGQLSPRKRNYWGDRLFPMGSLVVEHIRRRNIRGYATWVDQGYRVVDDIPETRRGVLRELTRPQLYTTLIQGAQGRIQKLHDEDEALGRTRMYESFVGAVRPRRGVKWKDIQSEDDLRWHTEGITIVAKEMKAVRAQLAAEHVRLDEEPLRYRQYPQPVVAAVF